MKHLLFFFVATQLFAFTGDHWRSAAGSKRKNSTQVVPEIVVEKEDIPFQRGTAGGISARYNLGKGIGYEDSYSTLQLFLTNTNHNIFPFLDGRGHLFNNGTYAANVSLGFRTLPSCNLLGFYSFYDYRQTKHHHYQQLGGGIEFSTGSFDIRANGYLPIGSTKSPFFDINESRSLTFGNFIGNSFTVIQQTVLNEKQEFAFKGANLEVGARLMQKDWILYAGAGPYAFYGHFDKKAIGGQGRLQADFRRVFSLAVSGSYDSFFKERFQGMIQFTLPFGPTDPPICSPKIQNRLYEPLQRQEILVLAKQDIRIETVQTSAVGTGFHIIFVNNTNPMFGDGSFENPFNTLIAAQLASAPGDIIYVFEGDGTDTGMNMGFLFKDTQSVLGSGVDHIIQTPQGPVVFPALTPGLPLVTNAPVAPVITLANNDLLSGIHVDSTVATAFPEISGTSITNLTIDRNLITSTVSQNQIGLIDVAGNIIVTSNTISTTAFSVGLDLNNTVAPTSTNIQVANNLFSGHSIGMQMQLTNISNAISVSGNTFTSPNPGSGGTVLVTGATAESQISFDSNFFVDQNNFGSLFQFTQNSLNALSLTNSNYTAPAGLANTFGLFVLGQNFSQTVANVSGNTFLDQENVNAVLQFENSSIFTVNASSNTLSPGIATAPGSFGLGIFAGDDAHGTAQVSQNTITQAGQIGTFFANISTQDSRVAFLNNDVRNAGTGGLAAGIAVAVQSSGSVVAQVNNNLLVDNTGFGGVLGFIIPPTGTGTLCLQLYTNNSNTGYTMDNSGGTGTLNLDAAGNIGTITENGPVNHVPPGTCN